MQGDILFMAQPHEQGHDRDTDHAGHDAAENAPQDGPKVFLQGLQLAVKGYRQADGAGGEQIAQVVRPGGRVAGRLDIQGQQQGDEQGNGNEHGVEYAVFELAAHPKADFEGKDGDDQAEIGRRSQKFTHGGPLLSPHRAFSYPAGSGPGWQGRKPRRLPPCSRCRSAAAAREKA